jgi:hypothetical protein
MNLIYFTLSNNPAYMGLVKLCTDSLTRVGYDGDLLFITNMRKEITAMGLKNVHFLDTAKSDLLHSSASKLRIFEYADISKYDKIIYCDLDILWLKSPDIIFEKLVDDKIYITEERGYMSGPSHSCRLLSDEERSLMEKGRNRGLSAGFFAFKSSMLPVLKEIYTYFLENPGKGGRCLEQPYVNVYLWKNQHLCNTSLTKMVAHNGWFLSKIGRSFDGVLLHFAGDIGRTPGKLMRMNNYITKYIETT